MRFFLLVLLTISLSGYSKAECYYSAYELKFEIETNDKTINRYARISRCDFEPDSIRSQGYLLTALSKSSEPSKISLFERRISYSYCIEGEMNCLENQKDTIFQLLNEITLSVSEIECIEVVGCKGISAMAHITCGLEISDAIWLNEAPIISTSLGFFLCHNQIFIHKQSNTIDKILYSIKTLKLEIKELNEADLSLEVERKYYDQMDRLIHLICSQEKVVVITECTD